MKLLEGKTALITGAARGIGRSIALKFASEGAHIAFSDLRLDEATQILEEEIRGMGVEAMAYASDASSFSDSEILVTQVIEDFGTIEILVNNAGITRDNLLMRMSEADWDLVMKVNLKSVFNLTKAVQKIMLKNRFGSIINMSSVVGVKGNAGQANYSASKAGIIGMLGKPIIQLQRLVSLVLRSQWHKNWVRVILDVTQWLLVLLILK